MILLGSSQSAPNAAEVTPDLAADVRQSADDHGEVLTVRPYREAAE